MWRGGGGAANDQVWHESRRTTTRTKKNQHKKQTRTRSSSEINNATQYKQNTRNKDKDGTKTNTHQVPKKVVYSSRYKRTKINQNQEHKQETQASSQINNTWYNTIQTTHTKQEQRRTRNKHFEVRTRYESKLSIHQQVPQYFVCFGTKRKTESARTVKVPVNPSPLPKNELPPIPNGLVPKTQVQCQKRAKMHVVIMEVALFDWNPNSSEFHFFLFCKKKSSYHTPINRPYGIIRRVLV